MDDYYQIKINQLDYVESISRFSCDELAADCMNDDEALLWCLFFVNEYHPFLLN